MLISRNLIQIELKIRSLCLKFKKKICCVFFIIQFWFSLFNRTMSAFFIPVRQFSLRLMMRQKIVFIGIILVIKCSILADHIDGPLDL